MPNPRPSLLLLLLLVTLSAAAPAISAEVNFTVVNNAADTLGGKRFERRIGADYSREAMSTATNFIWDLLEQTQTTPTPMPMPTPPNTTTNGTNTTTATTTTNERRDYTNVTLYIEPMDGADGVSAYARGNNVHISANYIGNYTGNVKKEFTGVLYHVLAYTWMWDGDGNAPGGLRSGMAEFVRLKAHYAPRMVGMAPGRTDYWDEGYGVTAMFLDYCNNIEDGFVARLNGKMKDGYSRGYFRELLGKSVDVLWQDYKSRYQLND